MVRIASLMARETLLRRVQFGLSAGVASLGMLVTGGAAHATDPCNGIGVGPGCVDYVTSGNAFKDGLTPILTSVLPLCVAMMAIWIGPRVFRSMLHGFLGH